VVKVDGDFGQSVSAGRVRQPLNLITPTNNYYNYNNYNNSYNCHDDKQTDTHIKFRSSPIKM